MMGSGASLFASVREVTELNGRNCHARTQVFVEIYQRFAITGSNNAFDGGTSFQS